MYNRFKHLKMKTVFKVGMEVYDQVLEPNKKGTIVEIKEGYLIAFPVSVQFENCTDIRNYTLDGRYNRNREQTLSTKPYKIVFDGFEQKAPIPTFEEAWKKTMRLYEPKSEYNKEEYKGYPSQELADASEALRRLLFLRDYYNEGWHPNKKDKDQRGVSVTLDCDNNFMVWGILKETEPYKFIFKNDETAEKFLEEQRELLEIAKPLL